MLAGYVDTTGDPTATRGLQRAGLAFWYIGLHGHSLVGEYSEALSRGKEWLVAHPEDAAPGLRWSSQGRGFILFAVPRLSEHSE